MLWTKKHGTKNREEKHTKTLNTIQTLSRIGKVLSIIVYICCIVGFAGCAVGIAAMVFGSEAVKIGGMTLHGIFESKAGVSIGTIWAAIAVGMILCIGEFYVARMAQRYFKNELDAGTPFTAAGAREMLHLGISVIWIPIVSVILAQEMIAQFAENVEKLNLDGFDSVALGVMFIFMSLLCKYGAESQGKTRSCYMIAAIRESV